MLGFIFSWRPIIDLCYVHSALSIATKMVIDFTKYTRE